MNAENLATAYASQSGSWGAWIGMAIGMSFGGFGIYFFVRFFFVRRETKIRGPALTGTAHVLSVRDKGGIGGDADVHDYDSYQYVKRIRVRVEVPGRAPYEATVRQNFRPGQFTDAMVGRTVPVEVDSTNPKRVRIDFSEPIAPHNVQVNLIPSQGVVIDPANPQRFRINLSQSPTVAAQGDTHNQGPDSGPVESAAALLASGQRVPGVLKSFAATGTTPRSLGRTPSRPELIEAPHYNLEVELRFPNLAPVTGRVTQPVPQAQVPTLAIGRQLDCAVDPGDPSHRFVVDWGNITY